MAVKYTTLISLVWILASQFLVNDLLEGVKRLRSDNFNPIDVEGWGAVNTQLLSRKI